MNLVHSKAVTKVKQRGVVWFFIPLNVFLKERNLLNKIFTLFPFVLAFNEHHLFGHFYKFFYKEGRNEVFINGDLAFLIMFRKSLVGNFDFVKRILRNWLLINLTKSSLLFCEMKEFLVIYQAIEDNLNTLIYNCANKFTQLNDHQLWKYSQFNELNKLT